MSSIPAAKASSSGFIMLPRMVVRPYLSHGICDINFSMSGMQRKNARHSVRLNLILATLRRVFYETTGYRRGVSTSEESVLYEDRDLLVSVPTAGVDSITSSNRYASWTPQLYVHHRLSTTT